MSKKVIGVIGIIVCIILLVVIVLFSGFSKRNDFNEYSVQEEYYNKGYDCIIKPSNTLKKYHPNKSLNTAINQLVEDNKYAKYQILDEWNDITTNQYTYEILFDDAYFYYVSIDEDGLALITESSYTDYLELNTEDTSMRYEED